MLDGSAPSPENSEVNSAVTGTRILKPLRTSTLINFRIAAELAVGEDRDAEPSRRAGARFLRRLRQADRQRMGIGRIDAQLELEFGGGMGRFAKKCGRPSSRSRPEQTLRVIFFTVFTSQARLRRPEVVSAEPPTAARPGWKPALGHNETISGNRRNRPET